MQIRTQNGIDIFQFESFPDDGVQQHGVFGRNGGVSAEPLSSLNLSLSVKDDEASVVENKKRAYGVFGRTQDTLVHAHLIHDNKVARVTAANYGEFVPHVDGIITNEAGCGLSMNFADCGSVFLYDPVKKAIGLGHSGWKGSIANLPGAMVKAMVREFDSQVTDILAALGPCISVSQYEVDEPVISEVQRVFPKWADRLLSYYQNDDGHPVGRPHFNLALANHINLYEAGVKNVELPGYCTASRPDLFFSHRGEKGKTGRFGAVFALN